MERISKMEDLFDGLDDTWNAAIERIDKGQIPRCRTCVHRLRYSLNDYSSKIVQCCELKPSKRSNSGYKTIKVTDKACTAYKKRNKQE